MVYAQTIICPRKWSIKFSANFAIQMDHLIPARRANQFLIKKKKFCHLEDFAVPADLRIKIEVGKKPQIAGPCQRTKKLWTMKVMAKLIVVGSL